MRFNLGQGSSRKRSEWIVNITQLACIAKYFARYRHRIDAFPLRNGGWIPYNGHEPDDWYLLGNYVRHKTPCPYITGLVNWS